MIKKNLQPTLSQEDTMSELSDQEMRFAELSQRWHGWGSPVGLGLFVLCAALAAAALIGALSI